MSRPQVKTLTGYKDAKGDIEGRLHTIPGGTPVTYYTSGAAAVSYTTTIATDYPGRPWILRRIEWTSDDTPSDTESVTLTKVAIESSRLYRQAATSSRPDTLLFSHNPAGSSVKNIVNEWEGEGMKFVAGDEVTMAYGNTGTDAIAIEVTVEIL